MGNEISSEVLESTLARKVAKYGLRCPDKQKGVINRLEKISDKVRVNQQIANKNANNKIKDDNKGYTLSSVTDGGDDGFTFI